MIGLALSRNLCRLGESLRPSAPAWADSRVGSLSSILTPPPLADMRVCMTRFSVVRSSGRSPGPRMMSRRRCAYASSVVLGSCRDRVGQLSGPEQ